MATATKKTKPYDYDYNYNGDCDNDHEHSAQCLGTKAFRDTMGFLVVESVVESVVCG